ncbi:MAG TPA: DUF3800 domain-containing protein [Blastocatellia bacterium]|nr:DUF3800 domain-containing protein [Blastocatellia bacterium]
MFRAYFDDSGTHVGGGAGAARIVVVGGIIATDDQHDRLKETWDSILKRSNLPYFHMTKFKTGKATPYCNLSDSERDVLLDQLVRIISVRARATVSGMVLMSDYDAVLTESEKLRYGKPYALASQLCWEAISLWAGRNGYHDPIPFVVEAGAPHAEQVSEAFNRLVCDPTMKQRLKLDSLVCGEKIEFPGLQAADIVANSTYELADHYLTGARQPSRWMNTVRDKLNQITNLERRTPNAVALRQTLDELNDYYSSEGHI